MLKVELSRSHAGRRARAAKSAADFELKCSGLLRGRRLPGKKEASLAAVQQVKNEEEQ